MVVMKKIIYILSAILLMAACDQMGNKELTPEQKICGEWYSTDLTDGGSLYLSLTENKTFELYQQISEGRHRLYRGSWQLEGDILTGQYNDGEDWGSAYQVTLNGDSMTLTSKDESALETIYKRTSIPENIKTGSVVIVKSN